MKDAQQNDTVQDPEFDGLMREFREAALPLAHREQAAVHVQRRERAAAAMHTEVRLRWEVPALAALALMLLGGGWGAWWYAHPEHGGHPVAHNSGNHAGQPATPSAPATVSVSDETLLSEVQNDLSDRVPQALQPLAVSYTSNSHAHRGQEEIQ